MASSPLMLFLLQVSIWNMHSVEGGFRHDRRMPSTVNDFVRGVPSVVGGRSPPPTFLTLYGDHVEQLSFVTFSLASILTGPRGVSTIHRPSSVSKYTRRIHPRYNVPTHCRALWAFTSVPADEREDIASILGTPLLPRLHY